MISPDGEMQPREKSDFIRFSSDVIRVKEIDLGCPGSGSFGLGNI
jgi:hypothetical protein